MKLATIRIGDGRERVAVVLDGERRLLDLGSAHERVRGGEHPALGSTLALIGGGDAVLELARQLVQAAPEEAMVDRSAVTLLAPIPVPPQIRDFLAFQQHLKGAFAMAEQLARPAHGHPRCLVSATHLLQGQPLLGGRTRRRRALAGLRPAPRL